VNEIVLMIAALATVMLIVIIYLAIKEKESARKMAMIETGIDTLNQELFKITKELESLEKRLNKPVEEKIDIDEEVVESIVQSKLKPFAIQMQNLDERVSFLSEDLFENIERIQNQMRHITFANDHMVPNEKQILQLHSQGMDAESIAKHLRLGKGEVELVLKFSKIHV